MNDSSLRKKALALIRATDKLGPALVIEEFGINNGQARADIAVFTEIIHGFELKSDRDSLERLHHQVAIYGQCFDKVTLVTGYKLAGQALKKTPGWWRVLLAHEGKRGGIHLSEARRGGRNPSQDPLTLCRILWRDEALGVLRQLRLEKGLLSKPRQAIYKRIATALPLDEIRDTVIDVVRKRKWRRVVEQLR